VREAVPTVAQIIVEIMHFLISLQVKPYMLVFTTSHTGIAGTFLGGTLQYAANDSD
jgi:hypothetical protein